MRPLPSDETTPPRHRAVIGRRIGHRILRRCERLGRRSRRRRKRTGERGVDRLRLAVRRDEGERDRHADEHRREDRGHAGQEVRRAARRHQARRAAAHAEAAAFRLLHQDHRHERGGDDGMNDEEEGEARRTINRRGDGGAEASPANLVPPFFVIPAQAGIQTRYRVDSINTGSGYEFPPPRE
ncbi:hypothetical protein WR25_08765 [Diploscapter pachys]|uniref:Uncharacterized protein n=1 Tax=Diploscapter pachys TaxID=2018661 RepID=A0A2A2K7B1_9BILA|nr:hypothetical protein WR25_08765 [Diploscapter pachys]